MIIWLRTLIYIWLNQMGTETFPIWSKIFANKIFWLFWLWMIWICYLKIKENLCFSVRSSHQRCDKDEPRQTKTAFVRARPRAEYLESRRQTQSRYLCPFAAWNSPFRCSSTRRTKTNLTTSLKMCRGIPQMSYKSFHLIFSSCRKQ